MKLIFLALVLCIIGFTAFVLKKGPIPELQKTTDTMYSIPHNQPSTDAAMPSIHCDMIVGDDLSVPPVPTGTAAAFGDTITWIARVPHALGENEYSFTWKLEGGAQQADAPNVISARYEKVGPRAPHLTVTKQSTGEATTFTCPTINIVDTKWPST